MREYQSFERKLSDVKVILKENYTRHKREIEELEDNYESKFRLWMFHLKQNINLLLSGVGSKMSLIEKFCATHLKNCCVLNMKCFNPEFSLRDVVKTLIVDVYGKVRCPFNLDEAIHTLKSHLKRSEFPVFLVVYNIDSIILRDLKRQEVLSDLFCLPKLHVIATVDHINSPLLWNETILSKFNFIWINSLTYQPYLYETWNKQILKKELSEVENRDFSVFLKIFNCCSDKVKKVVQIIIEDRIKNDLHEQQGMNVLELYARAQEEMLLGHQPLRSLNNLLKDFYEHNVIRKTNSNCIVLHVDKNLLQQFCHDK